MEDLSIKEIAEILEQKEGTIKSRLNRARNS
ncbi:sigma factor-like helix-turn-helix DNA-binding protein [Brevibacillus marinus]